MDEKAPTVEMSLEALSEAVEKATEDLCCAGMAIERARADIASRNTSIPRGDVVRGAEKAIDHLRQTDECLRDVLKDLADR
jgi:hypothetical protein